jgi:hypothetical protein
MAALPYPGVATATPQVNPAGSWNSPTWNGAQPVRTFAASDVNGGATYPMPVPDTGDPCAETRMATRPVRRFFHNLICPESTRLAPTPTPLAQNARPQQYILPGYHSQPDMPITPASAEVADGEARTQPGPLPVSPEIIQAGPALTSAPGAPHSNGEILQATFAEVVNPTAKAESITPPAPLPSMVPKTIESSDAPPGPPVHLVCERSIRLNCKLRDVGPSGLSAVEVWYTQDGKRWLKAEHTCPPQPPYVMDVKDDGRYGITLIARNGLGVSKAAPVLGEAPQVWVEVDTTRPTVQIGKTSFTGSDGSREMAISWTASDKNLGPKSIKLAYAEKTQGPWAPIADVDNTGSYRWRLPPKMPTSFFIRVQATDTAGNAAGVVSAEPIVLDMSKPTVEILSVESYRRQK